MKKDNNGGNKITNYFAMKNITKVDRPMNPPKSGKDKGRQRQKHDSSREGSVRSGGTEIIISSGEQNKDNEQVCKQLIFISAMDVSYFPGISRSIEKLLQEYSKKSFLEFILQNVKYNKTVENLNNLDRIDDEQFWNGTLPLMLKYAADTHMQKSISACIQILSSNKTIMISRMQAMMILINMFLCIVPRQTFRPGPISFGLLFNSKSYESNSKIKQEKLKCIINYFKRVTKRDPSALENEFIEIKRGGQSYEPAELTTVDYEMRQIEIREGLIEDEYQNCIMVDFANKNLGGGVLNNGAVQEEILFLCFPQLITVMCLAEQLNDEEAVIIEGAERYNEYDGYSDSFSFKGPYKQRIKGPFPSIFLAVDALNFSEKVMKSHSQFLPLHIQREIFKFRAGVELAGDYSPEISVCTGRWGCGAFRGDPHLKIIIQWIACSIAGRNMIYMAQDKRELKEMGLLVENTKKMGTIELVGFLYEYHKVLKSKLELSFLEYLKDTI